jgi:polar amino acid transport system substrate-binding protein
MTSPEQANEFRLASRRSFMKGGGALALTTGVMALAACQQTTSANGPSAAAVAGGAVPGSESVLDRWIQGKSARLGVDLSSPPIQFRDPKTGRPTGYQIELTQMMMSDLGVTPEYVEIPFGQLFAALAAGKFEMTGIAATILPSRALKGLFAGFPAYYESIVVLLKPGSTITKRLQLDSPGVRISAQLGSSQEFSGRLLFPRADFSVFAGLTDAINEVATRRADAVILSEFAVRGALNANPDLQILPGLPLFVDANTYFLPLGDFKLWAWVTNWLRYTATHQVLSGLWDKWVGTTVRTDLHLETFGVGPGGEPVILPPG